MKARGKSRWVWVNPRMKESFRDAEDPAKTALKGQSTQMRMISESHSQLNLTQDDKEKFHNQTRKPLGDCMHTVSQVSKGYRCFPCTGNRQVIVTK
jgi:hypothetical protein